MTIACIDNVTVALIVIGTVALAGIWAVVRVG